MEITQIQPSAALWNWAQTTWTNTFKESYMWWGNSHWIAISCGISQRFRNDKECAHTVSNVIPSCFRTLCMGGSLEYIVMVGDCTSGNLKLPSRFPVNSVVILHQFFLIEFGVIMSLVKILSATLTLKPLGVKCFTNLSPQNHLRACCSILFTGPWVDFTKS